MKQDNQESKKKAIVVIKYPVRPWRYRLMNLVVRHIPVAKKHSHNSVLMTKNTAGISLEKNLKGYDFRLAGADDISSIVRHPEALSPEVYEKRLQAGDECYCLVTGSGIVSYNWIRYKTCCVLCGYDRGLDFYSMTDTQAFTYDFYTYKAHRGKGLGELMKKTLVQYMAEHGITDMFSLVTPDNHASMKIHLKLGYVPLHMVYGYRIGNWSPTYYGAEKDRKWLDEWFGQFRLSMNPGKDVKRA